MPVGGRLIPFLNTLVLSTNPQVSLRSLQTLGNLALNGRSLSIEAKHSSSIYLFVHLFVYILLYNKWLCL